MSWWPRINLVVSTSMLGVQWPAVRMYLSLIKTPPQNGSKYSSTRETIQGYEWGTASCPPTILVFTPAKERTWDHLIDEECWPRQQKRPSSASSDFSVCSVHCAVQNVKCEMWNVSARVILTFYCTADSTKAVHLSWTLSGDRRSRRPPHGQG